MRMNVSDGKPLQAGYGPCLQCLNQLDLTDQVQDRARDDCFRFPFWLFCPRITTTKLLLCSHCGFSTDLESYDEFSKRGIGAVSSSCSSASLDVSNTEPETTEPSACSNQQQLQQQQQREEHPVAEVSTNTVKPCEPRYACQCCDFTVSQDWRFCPKCGWYIEDASSSSSSTSSSISTTLLPLTTTTAPADLSKARLKFAKVIVEANLIERLPVVEERQDANSLEWEEYTESLLCGLE